MARRPRNSQPIPRRPDGSLQFTSGPTPTSVGERGNTGPTTRSQQTRAQESRNNVGRIMNSPAGYPSRRNPSGRRATTGGSPSPSPAPSSGGSSGGGSPAAQAVTGASSTGTSTTSRPQSGPTTTRPAPKAGTAKPKKGTVLHKALKNKNRMRFNEFDKKDRNQSVSFLKKNYEWARKKGNEDRVEKVASHLMGTAGSALSMGKPNSIGVRAKGQSRKPPKGVSDAEFKREVAKYKASHKAARDPKKAKNVEAIVATMLRGRKKKDGKGNTPPSPGGGADTPPAGANPREGRFGGGDERAVLPWVRTPEQEERARERVRNLTPEQIAQIPGIGNPAGYAPGDGKAPWGPKKGPKTKTGRHLPSGGPDRPPTPKKKRPKPGSGVKRSHNGRVFDSQ